MPQLPNSFQAVITFLSIPLLIISCSPKTDKNEALIKAMEKSLESSNRLINASSSQTLHSLENKSKEPITMYRAEIWLPKAQEISKLSNEIYSYLEKIKNVEKINFDSEKEISIRLSKFSEDVASVDSFIRREFYKYSKTITITNDSLSKTREGYAKQIFSPSNNIYNKGLLTKLQNSIRILENRTITFCNEQIGSMDGWGFYDSYSAIVGQSSNIVKMGSEFEINAGVGAYSLKAQPNIQINGKQVPINEQGFASFKLIAPQKPGNYTVPVLINYFNPATGKKELRSINIEYTVAKHCN